MMLERCRPWAARACAGSRGLRYVRQHQIIVLQGIPGSMTDLQAADELHMAGEIDAAADAYRRVIAADPGSVAAWHGLGGARLRARAYGEASDALFNAVRLKPDDGDAWGLLAEALFQLGEVERAVDAYRRAAADASLPAAV